MSRTKGDDKKTLRETKGRILVKLIRRMYTAAAKYNTVLLSLLKDRRNLENARLRLPQLRELFISQALENIMYA